MEWKRSSRCAADSPQCVEVSVDGSMIFLRDSKAPDSLLTFTREEWAAFVAGLKAGEFLH